MAGPTYQSKVYHEQGGRRFVVASSGSLDVESGGEIDIESGGAFRIAGTAITASAAEVNRLAGVTPGTAKVNSAAVLGANRNLDRLTLPAGGLRVGTSSGTAVSATAAELNTLAGVTAGTAAANKALVLGASRAINNDILLSSGASLAVSPGGFIANRSRVESVSTAATLAAAGLSIIASTGAVVHTLPAASPGLHKQLVKTGNSTALAQVKCASGTYLSTEGTRGVMRFLGRGHAVTLVGLSTAAWGVVSRIGVALTTST